MKLIARCACLLAVGALACDDMTRPGSTGAELSIEPDLVPTLPVGATLQLAALVNGTSSSAVDWRSSDTSVVTVNQSGLIAARDSGDAWVTAVFMQEQAARDSVLVRVRPFHVEVPGPTVELRRILDHATRAEITNAVLAGLIDVEVFWDAPPVFATGQLFVQLRGQNLCNHKFFNTPRSAYSCTIDTRPFPNDTTRIRVLLADTAGTYIAVAVSQLLSIAN